TGGNLLVAGSGIVWLLDGTTGSVIQTFTDPVPGGAFGGVGIFCKLGGGAGAGGNDAIAGIGDPGGGGGEPGGGAAYAVELATGTLLYTLHPPEAYETFEFGARIAVAGTTLLVGAPRGGEDGGGEVDVYDGMTGTFEQTLIPPHQPRFGAATAQAFG